MIDWFIKNAPIRMKLLVAFGTLAGCTALATLAPLLWPSVGFVVGMIATAVAVRDGRGDVRCIPQSHA